MSDGSNTSLQTASSRPLKNPRLYSIPSGAPFIPAFVEALLAQKLVPGFPGSSDPLALSAAKIFVPTRRAARALSAEIARQLGADAAILPQILPLGSLADAEEASLFDPLAYAGLAAAVSQEAMPELERRLILTDLIIRWGRQIRHAICSVDGSGSIIQDDTERFIVTSAPGQAFHMAGELAGLIDEMIIEDIDWRALHTLTPDNFDQYWSITLEFLKIAMEHWPKHLTETGRVDAAQRNVLLAEAEAKRLLQAKPTEPYIVAGSTGTNAATAKLMAAIAQLPNGAVVLPGLDHALDEASWSLLTSSADADNASGHPQAALARLLARFGVSRDAVLLLAQVQDPLAARMEFLTKALLPPEATSQWNSYRREAGPDTMAIALSGITYVDAENEHREAQAIAVAMREVLEQPDRTAALVTPDRNLARRVRAELLRWDLIVDDSGGETLRGQPTGIVARLAIQLAQGFSTSATPGAGQARTAADPVAIIALLNHADVRLGYDAASFRRIGEYVEAGLLRGPALDLSDIVAAIHTARERAQDHYAHPAQKRIDDAGWAEAADCLERLRQAFAPLSALAGEQDLRSWFTALRDSLSLLMEAPADDSTLQRADHEALDDLISDFISVAETDLRLSLNEFAAFFDSVSLETQVRGPQNAHPRLKILGLLEARLLSADVTILAGLDETIWPPAARADAFLNRPMREKLGLSAPEKRIGQTGHDFVEAMGAATVIVTRSRKRDGAPAIPSRLIQRMAALAGPEAWGSCEARGRELLRLGAALDHAGEAHPVARPEPRPPVDLRPTRLSVTQIETWRRDPYAIYARRILGLTPLDAPGLMKTPADIGNALHAVIDTYQSGVTEFESAEAAHARMDGVAHDAFSLLLEDVNIKTFRWSRIIQALHSFVDWELERRPSVSRVSTEQNGSLEIKLADGSAFILSARADRIEQATHGYVSLVDYKSSRAPTQKVVAAGFAPQLTLEAAIVEQGGFDGIGKGTPVGEGLYLTLLGPDGVKPLSIGAQKGAEKTFEQLKGEHLVGLIALANQFRLVDTAYVPRPYPQHVDVFADYDHLARVKEWSGGSGGDEA